MTLAIIAIWGDLEASLFATAMVADEPMRSLRCPVMITAEETGIVRASVSNKSERTVTRSVRTNISLGFVTLMQEDSDLITLAPGETRQLSWEVTEADSVWGRLVLLRVHLLRSGLLPSQSSACGIMTVNVTGFTGNQIVAMMFFIALTGIGVGGWLWRTSHPIANDQVIRRFWRMVLLGTLVLATLIVGLAGVWIVGVILILATIIVLLSLFAAAAHSH